MPANVSDSVRPMVTAGFANEVEDVNQYAAMIQPATANGTTASCLVRTSPAMRRTRPNVATTSPSQSPWAALVFVDNVTGSRSNITLAVIAPTQAPAICAVM